MSPRVSTIHFFSILAATISSCATPLDPPTSRTLSSVALGPPASPVATGPESRGALLGLSGTFYPLQLGNHWHYRKQVIYNAIRTPSREPTPPFELNATIDRDLICVARRDERDYVVEQAEEQSPYQTFRTWIHFRQDRAGLYEADLSIQEPPLCGVPLVSASSGGGSKASATLATRLDELTAVGSPAERAAFRAAFELLHERLALVEAALGMRPTAPSQATALQLAGSGELTRLRYPLHRGARWIIRNGPGVTFVATLEGTDVLDLPAGRLSGYRIRISSDFLGPTDRVRVWYGTSGFLQLVAHTEAIAVDPLGQPSGRVFIDQRETLDELRLAGPAITWPPIGGGPLGR